MTRGRIYRDGRVFTNAPGAPLLSTFCAGLLAGEIAPKIGGDAEKTPMALAEVVIFAPTRRAGRALRLELARQAGGATFLPPIHPLGALDDESAALIDPLEAVAESANIGADAPPAIDALERRLALSELTLTFTRSLKAGALQALEGEPRGEFAGELSGATPADAISLAGQLARLIDEFLIEGVDPAGLNGLVAAEHSYYWDFSAKFLDIALTQWPRILRERGLIDAAAQHIQAADRRIKAIQAAGGKLTPIVLGSTGSNPATRRLMQAVLKTERGIVVLPGLDMASSDTAWRAIAESYVHPQGNLARLLRELEFSRDQVRLLPQAAPINPIWRARAEKRAAFVTQALAPADWTPHWRDWLASQDSDNPLAGVIAIEAEDERQEALAIALMLREVLETPGRTAALASPDRAISRRVAAELRRWGVSIDDSGGTPLAISPAGVFARLALDCVAMDLSDAALAALISHARFAPAYLPPETSAPDDSISDDRRDDGAAAQESSTRRDAQILEQAVLRATFYDQDFERRLAQALEARRAPHADPFAARLEDSDLKRTGALAQAAFAGLKPLSDLDGAHPLSLWARAHRDALDHLSAGAPENAPDNALEDAFEEAPQKPGAPGEDEAVLRVLLESLARALAPRLTLSLNEYRGLFESLAEETIIRGAQPAHPRIKILGLLEMRLIEADLVIAAGLDETIWPPQPKSDAILNRPMRAALGLTPPDRRIGQSAHDFEMCLRAQEAVLTRAKKRGGAPTTPSRFIQRIQALRAESYAGALARGKTYLDYARALDAPIAPKTILRPMPKPSLDLRPKSLSVTRIETLRRDPYAIYAEKILNLRPLGALDAVPGPAEIGTAVHAAFHEIVKDHALGFACPDARVKAQEFLERELGELLANPAWRAFAWPRLLAGIDYLLAYEDERRPELQRVYSEINGGLDIALPDGGRFRLTARADRIELLRDGSARIVDYKTGAPPSVEQVRVGLAPQMTLQAALLERGGFRDLGEISEIESLLYLRIGGRTGGAARAALGDKIPQDEFQETIADHWAQLLDMLASFRDRHRGYPSRPFAQFASRYGTYDHLARVKEWAAGGGEEA